MLLPWRPCDRAVARSCGAAATGILRSRPPAGRVLFPRPMLIKDLFATGQPLVSFEFFPPKTDEATAELYKTITELRSLRPSYVSVTYGAGGSTRDRTVDLVIRIERELGIT